MLILSSIVGYAQSDTSFMGFIKLNDTILIPYNVSLHIGSGVVSGYSVTDMHGKHETKSIIEGVFDYDSKQINFKETGIVYTKSPVTQMDFCHINFKGKYKINKKKKHLEGKFTSVFSDGVSCLSGDMFLKESSILKKRAVKMDKKIQRSRIISKEHKQKAKPIAFLDSLRTNYLNPNENLSMFCKSEKLEIYIWDDGKVDGDVLTIKVNDKIVLRKYIVKKEKKYIEILLIKDKTKIEIEAISEGVINFNTSMIEIVSGDYNVKVKTNFKKNDKAIVWVYKK